MLQMSYHAGWDHFSPEPGAIDVMHCRVCDAIMDVKRNVNGATGYAEAMSGHKHLHDSFSCKYAEEDWHCQVRILKQRIEDETSQTMAGLLAEEMNEVLKSKKPTKDMCWKYKWIK
jgi:deoxycytidylate deaminase